MKRIVIALALIVGLLPAVAAPALADHFGPGHLTYAWPTHSAVVEDRTGNDTIRQAAAYVVGRWNDSGADLRLTYRDGPASNACGFEGNVISICTSDDLYNQDASAETVLSLSGSTLVGAWVRLRPFIGTDIGAPNTPGIIAHELGHAICCYDHSDGVSIMDPLYTAAHCGYLCTGPSEHDYEALRAIYGPTGPLPTPTTAPAVTTVPTQVATTTIPPTTTTTTAPPSAAPSTYCTQLQSFATMMRGPWFAATRDQALAAINAALAGC